MALVQRNDSIEALAADGADETFATGIRRMVPMKTFATGIRLRCVQWRPDGVERHRPKCVVDRRCENGVAVVDEEPSSASPQ